jgi:lipopolysaccharide exporter
LIDNQSYPSTDDGLWSAFARNVRVNVFAEIFSQGVRVGGFIFLARHLKPADFGILKILIFAAMLVGLLTSAGIPDAIIQRQEITPDHEATAWWLNLGLAACSAALLFFIARSVAAAMAMPALTASLPLLALPVFVDGTSSIANARLRRQLRFRALAIADFSGEVAFVVTAISLIWLGLPRWSLLAALATRLTCHGLVVWMSEPYFPRRLPRLAAARDLFRFSSSVWGGRVLGAISGNADYLLVGRLLGSQILGYYALAWDLLRFVPDRLDSVAGRVTLPAFCRLQHDNQALARAYREFTAYLAKLVLPLMVCVSIAAPYVVVGLYGSQWQPAATPLRVLAVGLSFTGLRLAIGSIYYTKDHPSFDIYLHGARLILIVASVILAAPLGLLGVSIAMSAVETVISVAGQFLAGRLIEFSLIDWFAACAAGMRLALLCGVAALLGIAAVNFSHLQGAAALILILLPCAASFLWFGMSTARGLIVGVLAPEVSR